MPIVCQSNEPFLLGANSDKGARVMDTRQEKRKKSVRDKKKGGRGESNRSNSSTECHWICARQLVVVSPALSGPEQRKREAERDWSDFHHGLPIVSSVEASYPPVRLPSGPASSRRLHGVDLRLTTRIMDTVHNLPRHESPRPLGC